MPEYADPVIDWLDGGRGLFGKKLYREVSPVTLLFVCRACGIRGSIGLTTAVPTISQSCSLQPNGSYTKDLSLVEDDLSRVCFMDNSPISYNWNKGESSRYLAFKMTPSPAARSALTRWPFAPLANALPIEGWTSDPNDEALLDMLPVLDSLRFTSDVRKVLGIRGF